MLVNPKLRLSPFPYSIHIHKYIEYMCYFYITADLTGLRKVSKGTENLLNLIYPYNLILVSAYSSRLLLTLMIQISVFWLPLVGVMEMPTAVAQAPQSIWSCHLEITTTRLM